MYSELLVGWWQLHSCDNMLYSIKGTTVSNTCVFTKQFKYLYSFNPSSLSAQGPLGANSPRSVVKSETVQPYFRKKYD